MDSVRRPQRPNEAGGRTSPSFPKPSQDFAGLLPGHLELHGINQMAKDFRLLWIGLLISVIGSRMQFAAILWHIRELSDQPIALGFIGLARVIPIIIFSLIGGAIADVFDRRKIMFITQSVLIGTAGALAWLTWSEQIQLWHIYALTVIEATAAAFDLPARQSLTPNLVPARDLPNAFSIQSIIGTEDSLTPLLNKLVRDTHIFHLYIMNA